MGCQGEISSTRLGCTTLQPEEGLAATGLLDVDGTDHAETNHQSQQESRVAFAGHLKADVAIPSSAAAIEAVFEM